MCKLEGWGEGSVTVCENVYYTPRKIRLIEKAQHREGGEVLNQREGERGNR